MRMRREVQGRQRILKGILTLVLVMLVGLSMDRFTIVSHAQSQARVTATSANIRKEPSTSSQVLGSAVQGTEITINSQVQGSDGKTWYQTFVNADTIGYIRSDLVEIIDGTTPPTSLEPTASGTGTSDSGTVEALNPVSATVKGGNKVRIRSSATTSGDNIITTVSDGLVVTVTGRISDSGGSGKTWYQVSYSDNGTEVKGFIRDDFLTISEELTPYVPPAEPENPPDEPENPPVDPEPAIDKAYDTELIDGDWYLLDYENNKQQKIQELYDAIESNSTAYEMEHKKAESEKVVIIILIFLLVAAASGIAMLVFKIRDMSDDAYFNQVERETLRRRGEARSQQGTQKVMHKVGAEKPASGRPASTKPAGSAQSQRPTTAKPAGNPQGQSQRPMAAKPAGNSQGQGQRPMAAKPAGSPQGQGQRPMAGKPTGNPQGGKPADRTNGSAENRQGTSGQKPSQGQQSWQSKNFMSEEDDEFEFGFLNYDGTEEK